MMIPYRIQAMNNINDKLNKLWKLKKLEYKRDEARRKLGSAEVNDGLYTTDEVSKIGLQNLHSVMAISKLLEDE